MCYMVVVVVAAVVVPTGFVVAGLRWLCLC